MNNCSSINKGGFGISPRIFVEHKPLYPTASETVVNPRIIVPTMYSGAESKVVEFWGIQGQPSKW